jgi:hypothetical protein
MADQVIFYISAASDLEAEREILGRAATEVPVDLRWRVVQSPPGNGPVELDAVAAAGLHVLVMGADIRAPIGLEWQIAWQAGRRPAALLKANTLRTPAGQDFVRMVGRVQRWERFTDGADLRRRVLMHLADHLLDHAATYVLTPEEIGGLMTWRDELVSSSDAVDEETRGGAGDSSVLLSRQRFHPQGGVVIGEH